MEGWKEWRGGKPAVVLGGALAAKGEWKGSRWMAGKPRRRAWGQTAGKRKWQSRVGLGKQGKQKEVSFCSRAVSVVVLASAKVWHLFTVWLDDKVLKSVQKLQCSN